ncbi:MAG: acyl carrier protein [Chitinispirillaceae bacterium]
MKEIDVRKSIRDFVNRNFLMGTNSVSYQDNDSFLQLGIIDSTGVLELVGYLQDTYGIQVADTDLVPENLDSIENVTSFIQKKRSYVAAQ